MSQEHADKYERARHLSTRHRGQATIEFTFTFIILLIFFFALMDFPSLHIKQMRASSLARESALLSWQNCTEAPIVDAGSCLEDVRQLFLTTKTSSLPEFTNKGALILSLYKEDGLGNLLLWSRVGESETFQSQYDTSSFSAMQSPGNRMFVAAEVFYNYELLSPIQNFLPQLTDLGHIYVTGVA